MTQGSNHRCLALASELGSKLADSLKSLSCLSVGLLVVSSYSMSLVWVPLLESPWETQTVVWWVGVQSVAEA
jgi:hypothetical protein